jgi:lambda family phage tail tape measure protein
MANIISRLGVVLGLNSAEFVKGLDTASGKMAEFANSAQRYGGVAVAALTAASVAALKYADEIVDVAAANDVAVDSVIKLSNALANSGGKAENAGKFLSSFTSFVDKAASGSDEAQKAFSKAGVSLKDLATLNTEQLFAKTAQNIGQIADPLTRNALAMEVFGRAAKGVDFTGLARGLQETSQATQEQAQALKDAAEMYDLFAQTGRDALQIVAVELGPPLKASIDYMKTLGLETKVFGEVAKTVFQTVAILGMNLGYVFKTIGTEIGGMAAQVAALMRFDFEGFRQIHKEMVADAEKARRELDAAEKRVMGGGSNAGGGGRQSMVVPSIAEQVAEWEVTKKREIQQSKEAQQQQKKLELYKQEIALSRTLADIDAKRLALQMDETVLGKSLYEYLSDQLTTQEQLAKIENKRQVDLIQNRDATAQVKKQINDAADAEAKRVKLLQEGKEKIMQQRLEYQALLSQIENSADFMRSEKRGAGESAAAGLANATERAGQQFAFGQSIDEQTRQNKLANERVEYEMKTLSFSQRRREELMAMYDLEVRIAEFQKTSRRLGIDEEIIQRRTQEIYESGIQMVRLTEQQKDAQRSFKFGWDEAFSSYMDNATSAARVAESMFSSLANNIESAIDRFVRTGKLKFGDLARSIIQDIIAIQLKAQASALFSAIVGGSGIKLFGSGPGVSQYSLSYGAPSSGLGLSARANGGDISSGQPYLVGERGPELVVPRNSGTVIPNHALAGAMGGQVINYNGPIIQNMNAIDTQSGIAFLSKNKQAVWAANQSAQRSLPVSR